MIFFKLIRWPNLLFIILTQLLFYYCVFGSLIYPQNEFYLTVNAPQFYILVLASVLIAAAGYIINDYFDVAIDVVNKPQKLIIDKQFNRRWAILFHLLFSVLGISLSFFISYKMQNWIIGFANTACVLLLWFYSTWFKRKLLVGNVVIALLTAWVTTIVYFFAGARIIHFNGWLQEPYPFDIRKLFLYTMVYSGFAFLLSLIREALKDIEDMYGDARNHCKTMPIVWGIPATKMYIAVWLSVLLLALSVMVFYAIQSGWWLSATFATVGIIIPGVFLFKKIRIAVTVSEYRKLSFYVKLLMLAGIISMFIFISPIR